ncbi:hypothetical protein ACQRBN_05100 [Bariatricus sp. SGI.154]|uniref:hypothetical protein n=1 Tax=Bariatricus sp. SGI.154 TaxID=3420549 RepID=UPI003D0434EB
MATVYTDTPHNFDKIESFVIIDTSTIVAEIYRRKRCYFYDACSFRRHANLDARESECLLEYMKRQDGIVVITRCILMELASYSGILNQEYIQYIKDIKTFGINVLIMYEEDLFAIMDMCFGTNAAINSYLIWAVRMIKSPVSTITETFDQNADLCDEVIKGKNSENRGIYKRFFETVRNNKESDDNLGEEMLAICLHILSHIPGEDDGKFCVITDDKSAGSKIDTLFQRTSDQHRGKKIIIFSTPKLVPFMYAENILTDKECMKAILSVGSNGNIVVLGTRNYDLRTNEISTSCDELADLIMTPNAIHIIF